MHCWNKCCLKPLNVGDPLLVIVYKWLLVIGKHKVQIGDNLLVTWQHFGGNAAIRSNATWGGQSWTATSDLFEKK